MTSPRGKGVREHEQKCDGWLDARKETIAISPFKKDWSVHFNVLYYCV